MGRLFHEQACIAMSRSTCVFICWPSNTCAFCQNHIVALYVNWYTTNESSRRSLTSSRPLLPRGCGEISCVLTCYGAARFKSNVFACKSHNFQQSIQLICLYMNVVVQGAIYDNCQDDVTVYTLKHATWLVERSGWCNRLYVVTRNVIGGASLTWQQT